MTDAAVITERFTMFEQNSLLWEITINDPLVYTRPFSMASALRRNTRAGFEIWEESCYEGEANSDHLPQPRLSDLSRYFIQEAQLLKDAFERGQQPGVRNEHTAINRGSRSRNHWCCGVYCWLTS